MSDASSRGSAALRRASVARSLGLAMVGCLLVVTLLAAAVGRQVSCSMRDANALANTLASPVVIDHAYDSVLPAAWRDRVGTVVRIESSDAAIRLPAKTPVVVSDVVEAVWPRHVARDQIAQLVAAFASAIVTGQEPVPVRFGPTPRGWSQLPDAARAAFDELAVDDQLVEQLVAPLVRTRSDEVLGPVLGVSLSAAESRAAALRILPSAWIRAQLVTVALATVPYFSGVAPGFAAIVELRSRIPIAVQVLHEQIVEEHAARRLVLDRFVDPLIEDQLARAGRLPLGIALSSAELREALLASIPPGWFARKTWVVLEAFSSYLTGENDEIAFSFPLAERNSALAHHLIELVRSKLAQRLAPLPSCTRAQLFAALRALRRGQLPRCIPATKGLVLDLAVPRIESEIERVVERLPAELVIRHDDVSARLGPARMAAIDELRARIRSGVVWTDEDLARLLVGAEPVIAAVRSGLVSAPDLHALAAQAADEPTRRGVALGIAVVRHPWILESTALVWLAVVAAIVTGGWAHRLQSAAWGATLAAASAAVVLVAVNWPTPAHLAAWMTIDATSWSRVATAVADGPLPITVAEWGRDLRRAAALGLVPWMLLGPLVWIVSRRRGDCCPRSPRSSTGTPAAAR